MTSVDYECLIHEKETEIKNTLEQLHKSSSNLDTEYIQALQKAIEKGRDVLAQLKWEKKKVS